MRRHGSIHSVNSGASADSPYVPSDKPSRRLYFEPEKLQALFDLWTELRNPGRRRRPEYIGQRLDFNPWLVRLIDERAELVRQTLARADAAPISGTVERPMTTTPKTKPPPKSTESAPTPARRGPKPGSGAKENITLSLSKSVVKFLRESEAGPSPTADAILLRSLRARNR